MTIRTMYRYEREPGKVTVSTEKPENKEYTETYRVIADDGKLVTKDGENFFICTDVDDCTEYYEVEQEEN